jgi:tetratricopeptide (TPR) repeat protein
MLGLAHLAQGHFEKAEGLLREALALARETGDRLSLAWVSMRLAYMFTWQGKLAEGLSAGEECQAHFDDLGVTWGQAHIKGSLGLTKGLMGHYQVGGHQIEQALTCARKMGDTLMIGETLSHQGLVALAERQHVKAQRCLNESAALFRASREVSAHSRTLAVLALAETKLGHLARALEQLCEALRITVEIQNLITPMCALPASALLLCELGEAERAVELYALALCFPFVANSRLWEDIAGQPISAVASSLPPDVVARAQARGRARDLWTTMEELLAEWAGKGDEGTA